MMQYGHKGPEARGSCRLFIGASDCHSVVRIATWPQQSWVAACFVFEVTTISVETTLPC